MSNLDETFRVLRATCEQYDPGVANIFEFQKRRYGQKTGFLCITLTFFELDTSNFWCKTV